MQYNRLVSIGLMSLTLVASPNSWAVKKKGDGVGNGGDPALLRVSLIKAFVNSELRNLALDYVNQFQANLVSSGPARDALNQMISKDIAQDILGSTYVFQETCKDIGGQAAGGAIYGDLGGDICISPKRLAELDSSKAEIVGLIIHEHAHHFGYVDSDYAIYKAVYQTVKLQNPAWSLAEVNASPVTPSLPVLSPEDECRNKFEGTANEYQVPVWGKDIQDRMTQNYSVDDLAVTAMLCGDGDSNYFKASNLKPDGSNPYIPSHYIAYAKVSFDGIEIPIIRRSESSYHSCATSKTLHKSGDFFDLAHISSQGKWVQARIRFYDERHPEKVPVEFKLEGYCYNYQLWVDRKSVQP